MSSSRALVTGAVVIALSAVPLYALYLRPAPDSPAPEMAMVPSGQSLPAEPAAEPIANATAPDVAAELAIEAPGFDLVRVAPDGMAVVAGRAEPGASVTIRADGIVLAEVTADGAGEFVAMFRAEPTAAAQALTLEAATPAGEIVTSEEVVVLLPAAAQMVPAAGEAPAVPPAPETREAATAPGIPQAPETPVAPGQVAGAEASPASAPTAFQVAAVDPAAPSSPPPSSSGAGPAVPDAPAAAGVDTAALPAVGAAAILRPGSVEVMPMARPPRGDVTLASISYTAEGAVTIEGAGTAGAKLRVYVDGDFTRDGSVDAKGQWSIVLADLDAGVYRLRVDQLASDGRVASRVETPFQRDIPQAPRPRQPVPHGPGISVTVQPGHNLWLLAREHYGEGMRYTQIFTANADQIRDPNLIHPGQILTLPGETAAN